MKRTIALASTLVMALAILLIAGGLQLTGQSAQQPSPSIPIKYTDPVGEEFPIGAWYTFPLNQMPTDEEFQLVKEAGINIGHQMVHDTSLMVKILDKAELMGLKMSFVSENIANVDRLSSTVERIRNHPALWGYYLKDEPKVTDFPLIKQQTEIIRRLDSEAGCFVNLWADWGGTNVGAVFPKYVEDFIRECSPRFLSVDIYPVLKDKDHYRLIGRYYETYAELLKIGNQHGIPFCAVGLATALKTHQWPAENNMRLGAFSALAYGAQAIIWWSYSKLPYNTDPNLLAYPLDENGNRTSIWYAMKTVNQEIQALRSVFRHCDVNGVWHTGRTLQQGCERLRSLPDPFDKFESGDSGALVSHISNDSREYLVIVSHDPDNSQKISITRKSGSKTPVYRVQSNGKEKKAGRLNFTLPPGGYVVLRFR